ncbi:hypothetical protein GCM10027275_07170 [Rhabdobacter roseus]|uniref:Uncharacterized protein n=1 Tax=Rhabdobacter roseus TaxID=1655419 RepID=A0A840TGL4_9BACT|nr:hypothetical protein [Rhabdobacter roseus]MBB5282614.1 hypothetical protein [Rhabdobacter roseus]
MNKEQFDRIESYLQDTLSEADKRSFEADLETDANLRKEWELHQKLNLGLRAMAIEKQLRNARHRANQRIKTHPARRTNTLFQIWSVAASIVLVLGLGWWAWQIKSTSDAGQLSALAEQEMTDVQYKSMPLDSLQNLTKTAQQRNAREKAEWYVALAYLKKGRKKEAKELLTRISNDPRHTYSQKAEKLLKQGFN